MDTALPYLGLGDAALDARTPMLGVATSDAARSRVTSWPKQPEWRTADVPIVVAPFPMIDPVSARLDADHTQLLVDPDTVERIAATLARLSTGLEAAPKSVERPVSPSGESPAVRGEMVCDVIRAAPAGALLR